MRQIEQARDHAVPCRGCRRETWNVSAYCDACKERKDEDK
jgi:hypothetical protein